MKFDYEYLKHNAVGVHALIWVSVVADGVQI